MITKKIGDNNHTCCTSWLCNVVFNAETNSSFFLFDTVLFLEVISITYLSIYFVIFQKIIIAIKIDYHQSIYINYITNLILYCIVGVIYSYYSNNKQ